MNRRSFLKTTSGAAIAVVGSADLTTAQKATVLETIFRKPPEEAGLSVVYHWTGGLVTKEGITADLEGMAASGIKIVNWFYFDGTGVVDGIQATMTLTPEWWSLVEHLFNEAKRLNLTLAPHICSTWGPAGAPEITPELSQQILIWSETEVEGGKSFTGRLPRPTRPATGRMSFGMIPAAAPAPGGAAPAPGGAAPGPGRGAAGGPAGQAPPQAAPARRGSVSIPPFWRDYYRDLAILAFPVPEGWGETSVTRKPKVTTNLPVTDLAKLTDPANNERVVTTDKAGWIQFAFDQPFTLRSVTINPGVAAQGIGFGGGSPQAGNPYLPAHSLEVEASEDGVNFRKIGQLEPMYNGWQTRGINTLTHTVKETRARFFRLVYHPAPPRGYDEGMRTGTRPYGADFRKMVEPLGLASVVLQSTPTVHHLPAKNNSTWGRGRLVTDDEIPPSSCIPLASIIDLTQQLREDGTLENWTPPPGRWKVIRFGYTSDLGTTGGGLHCDKYSADAARVVYHAWFGEFRRRFPESDKVFKILNIDSWENGSQNWSPVLVGEFRRRRRYDPLKYLLCMAGVMVESARTTEAFLLDMRRTMSDCLVDNFYGTIYQLARQDGVLVMSESVNQAMNVDDLEYFKYTDWTGGEFWVRATQNWKPNDVADAVSAARIYGKKIVFQEAFTGGSWQEHPFSLKAMGDLHYAEGTNRMMLHVWNEQYYPKRVPGQPGAGTPFNHLNTWWRDAQPWRDYMKRVQALLQAGDPVEDVLYFSGENLPCRALVHPKYGWCWPADPPPPEGYKHATINRDALLRLTSVRNGRIVVSGLAYRVLVLKPSEPYLAPVTAQKLKELVEAGAVVVGPRPLFAASLEGGEAAQKAFEETVAQLWGAIDGARVTENKFGKGRVIWGKPLAEVLASVDAAPDVVIRNLRETATGKPVVADASAPDGANPVLTGAERQGWGVVFCHRAGPDFDIYFLSNQEFFPVSAEISFRTAGRAPEFWDADKATIEEAPNWRVEAGRTVVPIDFEPSGSVFVVFRRAGQPPAAPRKPAEPVTLIALDGPWDVTFPLLRRNPINVKLAAGSWTEHNEEEIKYFSGTATYRRQFALDAKQKAAGRLYLYLGEVHNLARVRLNGKDLGVAWKAPYVIEITQAVTTGANRLEIDVTNTWVNRLIGDASKPDDQRVTSRSAAGGGLGRAGITATTPLLPAGLLGPVKIVAKSA